MALPLALGGCAGVLVVGGLGAAAGGGYAAAQERGVNGSIDDFTVDNVPGRLRKLGDLWKPLLAKRGRFKLEAYL